MVVTVSSLSPFVRFWQLGEGYFNHLSKLNSLSTGVNARFHAGKRVTLHIEKRVRQVSATLSKQD
jgi:hypothetical protein